jgi:hypothetical protein
MRVRRNQSDDVKRYIVQSTANDTLGAWLARHEAEAVEQKARRALSYRFANAGPFDVDPVGRSHCTH